MFHPEAQAKQHPKSYLGKQARQRFGYKVLEQLRCVLYQRHKYVSKGNHQAQHGGELQAHEDESTRSKHHNRHLASEKHHTQR